MVKSWDVRVTDRILTTFAVMIGSRAVFTSSSNRTALCDHILSGAGCMKAMGITQIPAGNSRQLIPYPVIKPPFDSVGAETVSLT